MGGSRLKVREVRPDEYQAAGRVVALAYGEFADPGEADWDEYLEALADVGGRIDRTTVLVAIDDGLIVGCVTLELEDVIGDDDEQIEPGAAHVRMLGVDPEARGRRIGRALMDACIQLARANGKHSVTLRTTERMLAAQGLYARMGFEPDPGNDMWIEDFHLIAYRLRVRDP
jgi:ribosomal protein S18 acetylase RimI-like enzyme